MVALFRWTRVLALLLTVFPIAAEARPAQEAGAPAPQQDDRFSGKWVTNFGPLELSVEGEGFTGSYVISGLAGNLNGEVEEGRLRFQYFGPGSDGEGWFELRDDGARLEGRWSPVGSPEWFPWNGRRDKALARLSLLLPGETVKGVLEQTDPVVTSNTLLQLVLTTPVRGKMYRIDVAESGPWFIELKAEAFDAYLILRDTDGNVLVEDDDQLLRTHSLMIELPPRRADERYLVEVCALDGRAGPFGITLKAGSPSKPTFESLRQAELADAEERLYETQESWGEVHPETATALSSLALVLASQGQLEEGQRLIERALEIREETLGREHLDTADSLDDLAFVLGEQGLYAEARRLVERALLIREEQLGPEHLTTLFSVANLGILLGRQGLFDECEALYRRCLETCEKERGPDDYYTALSASSLGLALQAQGRAAEARPHCERACEIWERMLGPDHIDTAGGLYNLALVLETQELFEEARTLLERCLRICERAVGTEHPYTAGTLGSLARVMERLGLFEQARSLHQRSLGIHERILGPLHPDTAKSLNEVAELLAGQGELESAFEHSQRAILATEIQVERTLSGLTENERLRYASELRETLELFLSLSQLVVGRGDMGKASYERLLAWKGRVSRSLLSAGPTSTEDEAALVAQLRAVQRQLANELYQTDVADLQARSQLLDELREERNALELALVRARAGNGDDEEAEHEAQLLEQVADSLPPGAIVVDFYVHRLFRPAEQTAEEAGEAVQLSRWSAPRLAVWVLRQGEDGVARIDLGEAFPIEEATIRFLEELVATRGRSPAPGARTDRGSGPSPAATELRSLLWQPLEDEVGDASLVFLSPDTFLGTLPFETLQRADGSYLVEHHGFVYLQDVASLPRLTRTVESEQSRLLLAGGIDYRQRDALPEGVVALAEARGSYRSTWRPLSATREEIDAIEDIHAEAGGEEAERIVLKKKGATEERIKLELPGCRYVHLATHGYFEPAGLPSMWKSVQERGGDRATRSFGMREIEERVTGLLPGLLSGLVFSGANAKPEPGRDNGLLTAEEVSTLDLSACDLVVLSACETGLGRAESGEGMLGLRRSFRQAGARTVISSLWSVKDDATSELMTSFYENLWLRGMGKLEALRRAQRDMLERNREFGGLPSTWGAFVLDGCWK